MYDWRKMTDDERVCALAARKAQGFPWHRPPHPGQGEGTYHLSAACFEHVHIIGHSAERIAKCERELLKTLRSHADTVTAWAILPNHSHALAETTSLKTLLEAIGQFHGRTSFQWNGEQNARGRKVWYKCTDRAIRTERHFWATVNYVHHNPVRHCCVSQWQDWPFSSAVAYLEAVGRDEARRIWLEYPLLDYGKDWDR